jgi:NADPH:quinone reductase-like Zn-dependent oxidoreductase
MLAALLTGFGGPEVLQVRDGVAVPSPEAGQVLVRVMAAAMNNDEQH